MSRTPARVAPTLMPAVRGYYFDDTREMIYAKNALEAISRRFNKNVFTGATIERMEFKPLNPENIEAVLWLVGAKYPVTVFMEDTCTSGPAQPSGKTVSLAGLPHRLSSYYMKYVIDTIMHSAKECVDILWDSHYALADCSVDQSRYLAMMIGTLCTDHEAQESVQALRYITKDKSW